MRAFASPEKADMAGDRLTRSDFNSEWELESFLHTNPEALLDETVLVFGRQVNTEAGEPDLLAIDRYGNIIVFRKNN